MNQLFPFKSPVFTEEQIYAIAHIFQDAGQVIFGITVISPLIGFDNSKLLVIILGGIGTLLFWGLSVYLARKKYADNI